MKHERLPLLSDEISPLGSPCARLMAEFIRIVTRQQIACWGLSDADDEEAGFGADINEDSDPSIGSGSDLSIGVCRVGQGFAAEILFDADGYECDQRVAEGREDAYETIVIAAAIDAELYAEVEEAYKANPDHGGKRPI